MKSLILKLIVSLAIFAMCCRALAATAPRGLVLYAEPPQTYVETLEFVTITNTNSVITTVVRPTGPKEEIPRNGIIAIINYPPATPTESLPQEADLALRTIEAVRPKFPQFSAKLNAAKTRWINSLEVYRQSQRLAKAAPSPSTKILTLEVDGIAYEQAVMTSFDGATVSISHAAGIARIPAIKLKPEQIAALNSTSTSVHIDPSKIVAELPKSPVSNSKIIVQPAIESPVSNLAQPSKQWAAQTVNADRFVEPDLPANVGSPTYGETLEFINAKLAPLMSMGFGEKTGKMIFRFNYFNGDGYTATFNPGDLNAEVRYEKRTVDIGADGVHQLRNEGTVFLEVRNGEPKITFYNPVSDAHGNIRISESTAGVIQIGQGGMFDDITAEKLAKAFAHLVRMFGGKKEAF